MGEFDDSLVRLRMMALVFSEPKQARTTSYPMVQARHPVRVNDAIHLVTEHCTTVVFS